MSNIIDDLIRDEGEVLHLYYDSVGVPTIGIGHNLRDVPVPAELCKEITITPAGAHALLAMKLAEVNEELSRALPWTDNLDPVRRKVLVNMAFNLGIGGLLLFKVTLEAVRTERWASARAGMLESKWASQVGDRAKRLAEQMYTGRD